MAAVLAVLAKEVALVILLGYALWRRDRRTAALVAVPLAAIVVWWAALHVLLPDGGGRIDEIVPPFVGLVRSAPCGSGARSFGHGRRPGHAGRRGRSPWSGGAGATRSRSPPPSSWPSSACSA